MFRFAQKSHASQFPNLWGWEFNSKKYFARNFMKCPICREKFIFANPNPMGWRWGSINKNFFCLAITWNVQLCTGKSCLSTLSHGGEVLDEDQFAKHFLPRNYKKFSDLYEIHVSNLHLHVDGFKCQNFFARNFMKCVDLHVLGQFLKICFAQNWMKFPHAVGLESIAPYNILLGI